jgi:hypothetical protein
MWSNPIVPWLLCTVCAVLVSCARNPTPRCGGPSECGAGNTCYRGFCIGGSLDAGAADTGCGPGQSPCGRDCVYLLIDEHHCGTCDIECHGGDQTCSFGRCVGS